MDHNIIDTRSHRRHQLFFQAVSSHIHGRHINKNSRSSCFDGGENAGIVSGTTTVRSIINRKLGTKRATFFFSKASRVDFVKQDFFNCERELNFKKFRQPL